MTQFGRPVADAVEGGWSGDADLFGEIDEVVAEDADLITTGNNPSSDTCEVDLTTSLGDPLSSADHIVRYRYKKSGNAGRTIELVVRLLMGGAAGTEIAVWTHSDIGGSIVQADNTLSGAQADAITDYTDLSLEFTGDMTGGSGAARRAQVSWAVFECPDVAGFQEGAADIAGSGDITAAPQMLFAGDVVIAGSAEAVIAAQMLFLGAVAIEGSGEVVVKGGLVLAGGVAIAGSGEIAVSAVVERTGAVAVAASAEITAAAQMLLAGDVAIQGSGNLTAAAQMLLAAKVGIAGSGEPTVSGEVAVAGGLVHEGAVDISGGAEVLALATVALGEDPFFEGFKAKRILKARGFLPEEPTLWIFGVEEPDGNREPFLSANKGSIHSRLNAEDDTSHVWVKVAEAGTDSDWRRTFVEGHALISNADLAAAAALLGSKFATNARRRILVSKEFDVDNGAGTTDDDIILLPSVGITVVAAQVIYTEPTDSGGAPSANIRLGTSVGAADIVAPTALEASKSVGGFTALTLVSGDTPVAANGIIIARHTGVAAAEAGKYKVVVEVLVND